MSRDSARKHDEERLVIVPLRAATGDEKKKKRGYLLHLLGIKDINTERQQFYSC